VENSSERYYTHEQKKYLLSILHKPSREVIDLFKRKYNIELTPCRVKDYRKYYKIKCEKNIGQFKKGIIPANTKKMYSEHISTDGYIWIKIGNNKHIQKQRWVWEQHNGKMPKDHCVIFLNKNTLDVDIDNLACVPIGIKNVAMNLGLLTNDREITKVGLILAELVYKRHKIAEENNIKYRRGCVL